MRLPRLRIGMLCAGWRPEPGGVQTVTGELAQEFMGRGHQVCALAFAAAERELGAGETEDSRLRGVQLRRVAARSRELRAACDLVRRPELELLAARWSAEQGLDLVHAHDLGGWGPGTLARLVELGLPVFWTCHDYAALCPRGQLWHVEDRRCERAEPEVCAPCVARTFAQLASGVGVAAALDERLTLALDTAPLCTRVYCPSEAARAVFLRHGFEAASISPFENGVAQRRTPRRVAARTASEALRIGVLGSVQPSKGVLELARWIVELGAPFELHVHGPRASYHGDSTCVEALEELAAREARIHLHGAFEAREREELFAQLDLVAVPSLWEEVHGLVAREARGAGLPVFASELGGLAAPGLHLLPPGDGAAWKAALARFGADPAWRAELRASACELRSIADMAEQLLADYAAAL
jgi:glycosyltransferase involved in cell wall biosynthesis